MKILKQGTLPGEKVYRSICFYCKTEFEYHEKEAKLSFNQRDGNFLTIGCPVCSKDVVESYK